MHIDCWSLFTISISGGLHRIFCRDSEQSSLFVVQILRHMMKNEGKTCSPLPLAFLIFTKRIPSGNARRVTRRNMCIPASVYANARFIEKCLCFCIFAGIGLSPTAIRFSWCLMRPERCCDSLTWFLSDFISCSLTFLTFSPLSFPAHSWLITFPSL